MKPTPQPTANPIAKFVVPLLALMTLIHGPAMAQTPIQPGTRTASISAFADGQSDVRFERRFRLFDSAVAAGSVPDSTAVARIVAGPQGPFAFGVFTHLEAEARGTGGRATAFATDDLRFTLAEPTPFTMSGAFVHGDIAGAAGAASSVRLEVDGEGAIKLADGSDVPSVSIRAAVSPQGAVVSGQLEAGRYRFRVEATANASAVDGSATAEFDARGLLATTCRVDLTLDGTIDLFDFLEFQILQARMDPRADFDGDGQYTVFDLLAFIQAFEDGC